jgi:hypothetical protein
MATSNARQYSKNSEAVTTYGWALFQNDRKQDAMQVLAQVLQGGQLNADSAYYVAVVFKDQVKNREIWHDDNIVKTANYYVQTVPGQQPKTELDGRKEAIQKVADEILTRSNESW